MSKVGIVCEDASDYDAISCLVSRILKRDNISFEKFYSNGCGRMTNKLDSYAKLLFEKNCTSLIVVHDRDKYDKEVLTKSLQAKLSNCLIRRRLICIPVEEIESWFLGDMKAVKRVFSLKTEPREVHNPENVISPKEELGRIVRRISDKRKISISTISNRKLANEININLVLKKCNSFRELHDFVITIV